MRNIVKYLLSTLYSRKRSQPFNNHTSSSNICSKL